MNLKELAHDLPRDQIDKETIYKTALRQNSSLKETSIHWLINRLIDEGLLNRVGRNKYQVTTENAKKSYYHTFSVFLQKLVEDLETRFPLIQFQAWEAIQFNRFANHQIAKNLYFIEVEKMVENAVYEFLREKYDAQVLLKPTKEICEVYVDDGTIIVQNLISEAPVDCSDPHHVVLEKLLVDLLADEQMELFLESAEFGGIIQEALDRYVLNESRMLRYARRRNREEELRRHLKNSGK